MYRTRADSSANLSVEYSVAAARIKPQSSGKKPKAASTVNHPDRGQGLDQIVVLPFPHNFLVASHFEDVGSLARDFAHPGGLSTIGVEHVSVGQYLENYRNAGRYVLPDHSACGVEFHQSIRARSILEEHQPMLDGRSRRTGIKRQTGKQRSACHLQGRLSESHHQRGFVFVRLRQS